MFSDALDQFVARTTECVVRTATLSRWDQASLFTEMASLRHLQARSRPAPLHPLNCSEQG